MTEYTVNEKIRSREVRLVDADGNMVGIVKTQDALTMAFDAGLDLVEVSPDASPPVCKILDYGKFLYEQKRKAKEAKANAKKNEVHEIRLRPVTDVHDLQVKAKKAKEFLADGNKVKVVVRFKGREMAHRDLGMQILRSFLDHLGNVRQDKAPELQGRHLQTIVSPA